MSNGQVVRKRKQGEGTVARVPTNDSRVSPLLKEVDSQRREVQVTVMASAKALG